MQWPREYTQDQWEHTNCPATATSEYPQGKRPHRFGDEAAQGLGGNRCVHCDLTVAMLNAGRR